MPKTSFFDFSPEKTGIFSEFVCTYKENNCYQEHNSFSQNVNILQDSFSVKAFCSQKKN